MKKITEAKQTVQVMEDLIDMQHREIRFLLNIVARYHKKHGGRLPSEDFYVKPGIYPSLSTNGETLTVDMLNYDILGMQSDYSKILTKLEQLKK